MTKENPICCLCGKECENEFGNNPAPLEKTPDDRCCNECNYSKVVPARLELLREKEKPNPFTEKLRKEKTPS